MNKRAHNEFYIEYDEDGKMVIHYDDGLVINPNIYVTINLEKLLKIATNQLTIVDSQLMAANDDNHPET